MDDHVSTRAPATAPDRYARSPAPPKPLVTPTRRRLRLGWLLVLLLLLAGGALGWHWYASSPAPQPAGHGRGAGAPPQPVGVAEATRGDVRITRDAIGTVTPLAVVTVRTQIAGQLQEVGFKEGQIVRKGDFLAQIDPRPYQALLDQYQGQLARDTALLKQAQADLVRYQTLLKQDSIARQQADNQVFVVQQYEAAIRSDQAQIDAQKLNLTYCHIVAPVDGRVGLRQVDAGNYVQTSDANGIVVITQLQPISVIFTLPEDDLPAVMKRLHAGAQLPVTAYDRANQGELAQGMLATVDNQIDTTTGTVKLRANFDNADQALFPNQFVNVRLLEDTRHGVVTVPGTAVLRGAPGTYVYLLRPDTTVTVRPVKTGPTDGDRVQILSGLEPGDRVVTDGTDRLREGASVTVREGAGATAAGQAEGQGTEPATGGQHRHRHAQQDGAQTGTAGQENTGQGATTQGATTQGATTQGATTQGATAQGATARGAATQGGAQRSGAGQD